MTTQNAMMERRSSEELRRLKLENTVLLDHNRRFGEQNGALIEEVEKLRMQLKDWKERLEHTQDALKEIAGSKIAEIEGAKYKRVLAEREACAKLVEEMIIGREEKGRTGQALAEAARKIRRRG